MLPVLIVVLMGGLLSACQPDSRPDGAAVSRDAQTLRVGLVTLPPMLGNPYGSVSIPTIFTWAAMFDALTAVTESGEVKPALAIGWEPIDQDTWRFDLRRDVLFHNGEPFNAAAVVATVDYLVSPEAVRETIAREMRAIAGAEVVDQHTVLIHTKLPSPLLPANMAQMFITEPGQWSRLGAEGFGREPIGTGPFRLIRWHQAGADFEAFKESWRPPQVERMEMLALPDPIARIQGIQTGQIDVSVSLSPEDSTELESVGGRADWGRVAGVIGVSFVLEGLPPEHPLNDRRVRQALNHAVDKQKIVDVLFLGQTRPASQPATASAFGFNAKLEPYAFDPELARTLLAEAGHPDGFSFVMEAAIGGGAADAALYQTVANDLKGIGVEMTIRSIPVSQLIRSIQQGGWGGQAFGMNYNAERTTDALRFTRLHSCIIRKPWFCDEALTERIQRTFETWDLEERRAETEAILAEYRDQAVAIFLHEQVNVQGVGPRVRGFRQDLAFIHYDRIELVDP